MIEYDIYRRLKLDMIRRAVRAVFEVIGFEIRRKPKLTRLCWPDNLQNSQVFFEYDKEFHELYDHAQLKTQMINTDNPLRRQRHYTLNELLLQSTIGGDVCEIGCWRGLSAYQIAHHIKNKGILFMIFDSFEGLSEIRRIDKQFNRIQNDDSVRDQFRCSLETVQKNLKEFNFVRYYKGWIPERFNEVKNRTFSFVHIDVDLFQPTYDSFKFFYPRLQKNGIMVFDDYGCMQFPGAKKAIDKCLKEFECPFFISLTSGQAFLVKRS